MMYLVSAVLWLLAGVLGILIFRSKKSKLAITVFSLDFVMAVICAVQYLVK
jgi:hypothetical protein